MNGECKQTEEKKPWRKNHGEKTMEKKMSYNTDYLTKRLSDESRKPFLRLGVVIRRFFCSKILGHKVDLGHTDSGYMVCERCQMHEYYDANFNSPALFLIPKRVKWWIIEKYKDYKRSRSNELPF